MAPHSDDSELVCPLGLCCPYKAKDLRSLQSETEAVLLHLGNNNNTRYSDAVAAPFSELQSEQEVAIVFAEFKRHGSTTTKSTGQFIAECRLRKPGCSVEDIVSTMRSIRISRNVQNPIGLLRTLVPELLASSSNEGRRPESEEERKQREAELVLAHPDEFDVESVEWARNYCASHVQKT
jgi:hypothetical protein